MKIQGKAGDTHVPRQVRILTESDADYDLIQYALWAVVKGRTIAPAHKRQIKDLWQRLVLAAGRTVESYAPID